MQRVLVLSLLVVFCSGASITGNVGPSGPGARVGAVGAKLEGSDWMLIVGGDGPDLMAKDSVYLYNFLNQTYEELNPTGAFVTSYATGGFNALEDLLLFGGESSNVHSLDLGDNAWTVVSPDFPFFTKNFTSLKGAASFVHFDDVMFVFGGIYSFEVGSITDDVIVDEVLAYNFGTIPGTWTKHKHDSTPSGRYGHTSWKVGEEWIIFGGSDDVEFFNDLYSAQTGRFQAATILEWERYNFTSADDLPAPRQFACGAVSSDAEQLFLFGGEDLSTTFDDIWSFNLTTRQWTEHTQEIPSSARSGCVAAIYQEGQFDNMFIFGGADGSGTAQDSSLLLEQLPNTERPATSSSDGDDDDDVIFDIVVPLIIFFVVMTILIIAILIAVGVYLGWYCNNKDGGF